MMSTTHSRFWSSALVLTLVLGAGCGGDDPVAPETDSLAQFAGNWIGTTFSVSSNDDPSLSTDLVAIGGNMNWAINTNGAFHGTAVLPGHLIGQDGNMTVPLSGVLKLVDSETLRLDFVPAIPPFFNVFVGAFTLVDNELTLVDTQTTFDFTETGVQAPATMRAVLVRN